MAYYTAVYEKSNPSLTHEKTIYDKNGILITKWQGRYFMYKNGYRIAELISGSETLNKTYKGDFSIWINSIMEKDRKKILKLKEYIKQIETDIKSIESVWDNKL